MFNPRRCLSKRKDTNFKANHNAREGVITSFMMFV